MKISHNISLRPFNTFGIDCSANELIEFDNKNEILDYFSRTGKPDTGKLLILGGGSNVLFTQNFEGTILKFNGKEFKKGPEDNYRVHLHGEAGINWHEFVLFSIKSGYQGLENLSLIPGLMGAAPIQNIGAYGVEIKDFIESVEYFDLETKNIYLLPKTDCKFGYRDSIFKKQLKGKIIILSVQLILNKVPQYNIIYKDLKNIVTERGITELSPSIISNLVIEIRRSKLPDPAITGNAGSFFKNPVVEMEKGEQLKKEYEELPLYSIGSGLYKISAAWLIERSNWKGVVKGQAGVHEKQPLVLINLGHATGMDILNLAMEIKESVKMKFGIVLEPEINII